jgi:hypothetical protein
MTLQQQVSCHDILLEATPRYPFISFSFRGQLWTVLGSLTFLAELLITLQRSD